MKGTVQAIIRADDGTARPFTTIAVDDVDAAVTELQGMASAAAPAVPAPPTADAAPADPGAPVGVATAQQPSTVVDTTAAPTPAPIADEPPPATTAPAAPLAIEDRVSSLESRVTALEAPKAP